MTKKTHFVTSFNLLALLFINSVSFFEIILFSYIFGVFLDENQRIGKYLKKPIWHLRTWIEEPIGFILIGIPLGILLSFIKREYFFLTIIPYGFHIILDYLTFHEVSPFTPFSKKNLKVGFFERGGILEKCFLIFNIIMMIVLLVFYEIL